MKGRMHKKMKSVDKALMEKNLLGENTNPLNKMVKSILRAQNQNNQRKYQKKNRTTIQKTKCCYFQC